jgi:hypothetical protein
MNDRRTPDKAHIDPTFIRETVSGSGRSITQILQEIVNRVSAIIRSEIRLATTEIRQDAGAYLRAIAYLVVAGVLACLGLGFVLLGAMFALEAVVAAWLAAVLIGVVVGIVAAVAFFKGRKKIRLASLRPAMTLKTLEENVSWIRKHTK